MNRRILIFRELQGGINLHDVIRAGDTAVDDAGNELFVLGVTPRLNLPEYENATPQDGDIWKEDDKLWTYLGGQQYELCLTPEEPSSLSSGSVSEIVVSSSLISSSSVRSSSSVFSSSSVYSSSAGVSSSSAVSSSSQVSSTVSGSSLFSSSSVFSSSSAVSSSSAFSSSSVLSSSSMSSSSTL